MATEDYNIRIIVDSLMGDTNPQLKKAKANTLGLHSAMGLLNGSVKLTTISIGLFIGATVTYAKFMQKATQASLEFNESLANVGTLIPGQEDRLNSLKDTVRDLSRESGKSLKDLSNGLYQVISAFGDTADTEKKLEVVTKGAIAGQATTVDSLNLLSAVTKAYGDTSSEALEKVSDLSFMTVKLGQTTFPELASSIQLVTAMAQNMGVSQEELFTGFATLTGVTGTASEVGTQLRGVLTALASPSEKLSGLYDEMKVSSGKALIAQEGFQGALAKVIEYAKNTGTSLQDLLGRQRAVIGATALGSAQAEVYAEKFEQISDSSGATETALNEVTSGIDSTGFAIKQLKSEMSVFLTQQGDKFLPLVGSMVSGLTSLVGAISGNITANDIMDNTFDNLTKSISNYDSYVSHLTENEDDLTGVERALLKVRQEQHTLETSRLLQQLSKDYITVQEDIKKYTNQIEVQTKRQDEATKTIEDFETKGLVDKINNATEAQLVQGRSLTKLGWQSYKYKLAEHDLQDSTDKLTEAQLNLDEVNLGLNSNIIQIAQSVADGKTNIDAYAISNVDLYDRVMEVVEGLKKEKEEQELLKSSQMDYSQRVSQSMKSYIGYTSEQLDSEIKLFESYKRQTEEKEEIAYFTQMITALQLQSTITGHQEAVIAEKYLKTTKATYEQQLFQLTVGEGLVKIANERAKAEELAKENYSDDAGLLELITSYYNEQEKQFKSNLTSELAYNLALQGTKNELEKIDLQKDKALKKLKKEGVEEQKILDDTSQLYDNQKTKIIDNAKEMYEQQLSQLTMGSGLVRIENERAKAIADAKAKYGENSDIIETIGKLYDEQADQFEENLQKELAYNLAIQDTKNEIQKIDIEKNKALEKLIEDGITDEKIIEDTNKLYDNQKDKIIENAEASWKAKTKSLEGLDEEQQIEADRKKAIQDAIDKYGEESDVLDVINQYYDTKLINYKKEESLLKKVEKAGEKVVGEKAYKNLKNIQRGVKKVQDAWSQMEPIISSISDAYSSQLDLQEQLTEAKIDGLEIQAEAERDNADELLDDLEDKKDERLNALQDMYDNDAISYEDYLARKTDINNQYEDDKTKIDRKAIDAENKLKEAKYNAEVAEFERNKKSAIVDAIISGAQGIMKAWSMGPIMGLVGSAIIGGATAYQVSMINKQPPPAPPTYLAKGGIAISPTHAVIGEGGEPEMVLPLSKAQNVGFGSAGTSGDTYNITGNTFVGIEGIDELLVQMEERKNVLKKRGRIAS